MKNNLIRNLSAVSILSMTLFGCAASPIQGWINNTSHPGMGSVGVVDNTAKPSKTGTSLCQHVLGIAWGDCSINAAKNSGNIKKVHSVDHKTLNIWVFYGEYETIVRGE